jgi:hypothetical protein
VARRAGSARARSAGAPGKLVVEAVFPFNLFMLSMRGYLRARVPIHAVVSTQRGEGQSVLITFPDSRQEQTTLRLFLKRPSDLISALKSLKVRVI